MFKALRDRGKLSFCIIGVEVEDLVFLSLKLGREREKNEKMGKVTHWGIDDGGDSLDGLPGVGWGSRHHSAGF
jgi:hypothetical protein